MRNKRGLVETITNATQGVPIIGNTVFWQHLGKIGGKLTEVQAKAGVYGFDKDVPPAPSPAKVLERAVRAWLREGSSSGTIVGLSQSEIASLSDDPDDKPKKNTKTSFQISKIETANDKEWVGIVLAVKEVDLAAYGVSYQTPLRVFLNLQDGRVVVSSQRKGDEFKNEQGENISHPRVAQEIKEQVSKYENLLMGDEIRALILKALDRMNAVSLREAGGIYYVEASQTQNLKNLDKFIQSLKGIDGTPNTAVFIFQGIIDEDGAKLKFSDMLYNGLLDEIKLLDTELKAFEADKKKRTIKATTTQNRMMMCLTLIRKVNELKDLLGQRTQVLTEQVEKLGRDAGVLINYGTHYNPNKLADDLGEAREGEESRDVEVSVMGATQTAQASALSQTPQEDFLSFLRKKKEQG